MPEWIQTIDDQVLQWFQEHRTQWLDANLQQVAALGSNTVIALLSLFVIGLLLLQRQVAAALLVLVLPVGAYFATDAIKDAVARPRPMLGQPPKALASSASFPSGSASLAMTGFLVFALSLREFWRRAGLARVNLYVLAWAVGVAGVVGVSRLYYGYHFLSDVVAGWLLGVAVALIFVGVQRLVSRS